MARQQTIKFLRTTKSNLDTQATANNLIIGEPYFITDTNRFAIANSASTYKEFYNLSEIDTKIGDIQTILESI